MRKLQRVIGSVAVILVGVTACSSGTGTDDGNNNTMTATINGASFSPTVVFGVYSSNVFSLTASDTQNRDFEFTIPNVTGTGNFQVGGGISGQLIIGSQAWILTLAGGSGSVTLTTLTSTYAVGSFNLSLPAQTATGASGTRTVVGTFTVYFGQT